MTVKEWIEELKNYDENSEVVFEFCDDVEGESWTEDKFGNRSVYVNPELAETIVYEGTNGECFVGLEIKTRSKRNDRRRTH